MSDTITLIGFVATAPRHLITGEGLPITSFRLASTQRRYDRRTAEWVDGETNWYTVTGFRQLAVHTAASVAKGDRVIVTGRLRIRDWSSGERSGTTIEVEAEALGHDLSWGTAAFTRTTSSAVLRGGETATGDTATGGTARPTAPRSGDRPIDGVDAETEPSAPAPGATPGGGGS
ncbi:single-stranded DNA-binding protein [Microbacteriaceae bacterium 4G12]